MDRVWSATRDGRDPAVGHPSEEFALASRGDPLVRMRAAIEARIGPVLLTGEAGVGKTWLWRRLRSQMPGSWRWACVDLSPANNPPEFYRLIGYGLGLSGADRSDASRLELAEFLQESSADGKQWVLVVDEAHSVSTEVLEELRILANRLGHQDGFGAMILVGQTTLARRLATRPLAALAARLSARVHLRPLDADEARDLLGYLVPGLPWDRATLERNHRDAGGNPRRLIHWAREAIVPAPRRRRDFPPTPVAPLTPAGGLEAAPAPSTDGPSTEPAWERSVVVPSRPPIRVEEGLIEVGWEPPTTPDPASGPSITPAEAREAAPVPVAEAAAEETIDDRYAALQAWTEWSRNQGRKSAAEMLDVEADAIGPIPSTGVEGPEEGEAPTSPLPHLPDVWADGQQGFAPYGQLFSKLRQSRDSR
jgi:AAA domain